METKMAVKKLGKWEEEKRGKGKGLLNVIKNSFLFVNNHACGRISFSDIMR